MRGVRFTKAEATRIRELCRVTGLDWPPGTEKVQKLDRGIIAKLDAAQEAQAPGANVRELEDALVATAGLKIARLITGHARASRQAANLGCTSGDMSVVGAWMDRQPWLHGPQTLIDVLNKWSQWLPKALATEPPPSLSPGLGGSGENLRPSTQGQGGGSPRRRPAPGLR